MVFAMKSFYFTCSGALQFVDPKIFNSSLKKFYLKHPIYNNKVNLTTTRNVTIIFYEKIITLSLIAQQHIVDPFSIHYSL